MSNNGRGALTPIHAETDPERIADAFGVAGVNNQVDTHVHTRYSDGRARVWDVEEMGRRLNIGCCITDHNEIRGSIRLWERNQIPTVPSMEIGSQERIELILYFREAEDCEAFFKEQVEPFRKSRWYAFLPRSLDYLVDAASERVALISLPHPYAPLWKNIDYGRKRRMAIERTVDRADCIEVFNGSQTTRANWRASRLCEDLARIPLGGSDSHDIESIGSVRVAFDREITSRNLFDSMMNARMYGVLGQDTRPHYVANTWRMAVRHSRKFINGDGEPYHSFWGFGNSI